MNSLDFSSLTEIIKSLDQMLDEPGSFFTIEIDGESLDMSPPLTREDKEKYDKNKHKIIKNWMKILACEYVEEYYNPQDEEQGYEEDSLAQMVMYLNSLRTIPDEIVSKEYQVSPRPEGIPIQDPLRFHVEDAYWDALIDKLVSGGPIRSKK